MYSLAGVMGGYYCYDKCGKVPKALMGVGHYITSPQFLYSRFAKQAILPSMQWKDPTDLERYYASNSPLAKINGEAEVCGVVNGTK